VCSAIIRRKELHVKRATQGMLIEKLWRDVCGKERLGLSDKYSDGQQTAFYAFMQTLSNGCVAVSWQEGRPYAAIDEAEWLAHGAAYVVHALGDNNRVDPCIRDVASAEGSGKWSRAANGATSNRKFARTASGLYVLGPATMEPGDVVCVLLGGKMPFCLRPWGVSYLLVGECYVHGYMNGEAIAGMGQDGVACDLLSIV
jgi:hypothetical protein